MERESKPTGTRRIGIVDEAISSEQMQAMASLFPQIVFETLSASYQGRHDGNLDILILGVDAYSPEDLDRTARRLKQHPDPMHIVVILKNADVVTTRAIARAGAADVLPAPVNEPTLALCLERLLSRPPAGQTPERKPGQVVSFLKAGGGVGATSLAVQAAVMLSQRPSNAGHICFADLDLQFGAAALHFDLEEALTIADCLAVGELLAEMQFATALAVHQSGVRVLAGPRDLTTLDALTPSLTESLLSGLRRDFALTILDLPSVWTSWTNRTLQLSDRIVLVTGLSVPHVHLVRRQLDVLKLQKLDEVPLTLVCNAVSAEQQNLLSIKSAERAIGRSFDVVVPQDERAMGTATNEGQPLAALRRGTKIEKAIAQLTNSVAANAFSEAIKQAQS